jgi:hypothetical protein
MKLYEITKKGEDYVDDFISNFVDSGRAHMHGYTNPNQPQYDIFKLLWTLREHGSLWKYMEQIRKKGWTESKGLQLIERVEEKGLITETRRREMDPDIEWKDSMYGARPISSELRRHRAAQTGTIDEDTWHEYEPDLSREYLEELEKI